MFVTYEDREYFVHTPQSGDTRYFIEYPDGRWLHLSEKEKTNEPLFALYFSKNQKENRSKTDDEARAMAKLYLKMNRDSGVMKNCIVTEHEFVPPGEKKSEE